MSACILWVGRDQKCLPVALSVTIMWTPWWLRSRRMFTRLGLFRLLIRWPRGRQVPGTTQTSLLVISLLNPEFSPRPGPLFILRGFIIHMCTITTSRICPQRTEDMSESAPGWSPFPTTSHSPASTPATLDRTGRSQTSCLPKLQNAIPWSRRRDRSLLNSPAEARWAQRR